MVLKFDVASLDEGFSFALGLEKLSGPLAVLGEVDHESERGAVTVTVGAESEGGLHAASVATSLPLFKPFCVKTGKYPFECFLALIALEAGIHVSSRGIG
ncbi:MAG: hypothetical protein WCK55_17725 [Verrucomicrobiota bacterium]